MAVTVETLDKLERRITLSLAADVLKNEVDARLKKLARTVKVDGFRPGKVPMTVVAQRYGYSVRSRQRPSRPSLLQGHRRSATACRRCPAHR